ncbi:TetR/AcrR family transcriptional regulator [Thermocrispum municipale]|jgi:AcrR family transcriptional regulator|uniref:TetR/AcrR family transcriptional regulator n=1 Tax=Thermocrispum municipale TaxID=37926 RepID=UPI0003F7A6C0|nr:TetR/AcrR family transcriptional regulator [Thermocrispum municipale]
MTTTAPRKQGRRGRPGYDLEQVLEVAAHLFYERGYDGTSMEELSKRLGLTKAAIYHHVAGKEELLKLIVDRALEGLFAIADEVRDAEGPAVERLERLVRGAVHVLADRLPFVTVLLRVRGNTTVEREALDRRRRFDRRVTELVKQAQAEGDVRSDLDPATAARLLFGLVNSLIEWYRPEREWAADDLADVVVEVAFDGLRSAAH